MISWWELRSSMWHPTYAAVASLPMLRHIVTLHHRMWSAGRFGERSGRSRTILGARCESGDGAAGGEVTLALGSVRVLTG